VVVVGNPSPEFTDAITRCRRDQTVIDLVRLPTPREQIAAKYEGICW
jgi:hypothetical protein